MWLNQQYIKHADNDSLAKPLVELFNNMKINLENGPELDDLLDVQKERTETLLEMAEQSVFFYHEFEEFDANAAKKHLRPVVLEPLKGLYAALKLINDWENDNLKSAIEETAAQFEIKMGKLAQPRSSS